MSFFFVLLPISSAHFRFFVDRVQVVTTVSTGPNAGYYFEGVGCATSDDDMYVACAILSNCVSTSLNLSRNEYGGLVFGYDANRIRLWAPDDSNAGNTNGFVIFVGDGMGYVVKHVWCAYVTCVIA